MESNDKIKASATADTDEIRRLSLRSRASMHATPKWDGVLDPTVVKEELFRHETLIKDDKEKSQDLSFDLVTNYISTSKQAALWKAEADRLLKDGIQSDQPLRFEGQNVLGKCSKLAVSRLSQIARHIRFNILVCQHDASRLLKEHCPSLLDKEDYVQVRNEIQLDLEEPEFQAYLKERDSDREGVYHALVNYLTVTVVRLVTRAATCKSLHVATVSNLAKIAAKLKVLGDDTEKYAEISLLSGEKLEARETLERPTKSDRTSDKDDGDISDLEDSIPAGYWESDGFKGSNILLSNLQVARAEDKLAVWKYFRDTRTYRNQFLMLIQRIRLELENSDVSGFSPHAFEVSSLVYGTGYEEFPTLVYQNRHGNLSTSSISQCVQLSYVAFGMFRQALEDVMPVKSSQLPRLGGTKATAATNTGTCEFGLYIDWEMEAEGSGMDRIATETSSMDAMVTLMVPLACTSPKIISLFHDILQFANFLTRADDPMLFPRETKFHASASLKTQVYVNERQRPTRLDALSLSESLMAGQRLLGRPEDLNLSTEDWEQVRSERVAATRKRLSDLKKYIDREWTFDQRTVTVKCRTYVICSAAGCLLFFLVLMTGGLLIGKRVEGVDPSNVVLLSWILTGVAAVALKIIKVDDWRWRAFLHGRVVCQSVTEISAVSGIPEQDVLLFLLHTDPDSRLLTRGPHNAAFIIEDSMGLSIDVKPTLQTLLLSGIIVLNVTTLHQVALICLTSRKNKVYATIPHMGRGGSRRHLIVRYYQNMTDQHEGNGAVLDLTLSRHRLGWTKVNGLYGVPNTRFG